jgi:large subunit ribosomal protein L25
MRTLQIERRTKTGTTDARKLRANGRVPVVLYGHGRAPDTMSTDARALEDLLRNGGLSGMIAVEDGGGSNETALVRDIQRDPVTHRIIHVDLLRVSAHENVRTHVRVVATGTARGVRDFGGVMDVLAHELEVEGPADKLPQQLEFDVSELGLHQHAMAGDIPLPTGFSLITPSETIVISIEPSKTARQLEEAAAPAPEIAQPEIIGEKPAEATTTTE